MNLKPFRLALTGAFAVACLAISGGMLTSCSDDTEVVGQVNKGMPFDPSKPVVVTGFTPEDGGAQDQIIVKGSNFGNDKSNVLLAIGGKPAVIATMNDKMIYAYVPSGAFSGEVVVTVFHNGEAYSGTCEKTFAYERKTIVGTLCGYRNEQDNQGELWGSFDVATGFNAAGCMTFDPLYPERLYIAYDREDGFVAELNLKTRMATKILDAGRFQTKRLRNIAFSLDGKYMLVSTDRADNNLKSTSVWIVTRNADGTFNRNSSCQPLVAYKQCNGVAVHPRNGEVYFNSYENGQLFRMNLDDYFKSISGEIDPNTGEPYKWTGYLEDGCFRELFKIQDPSFEFQVTIHPSGTYAYLTVINRDYILRTDYDERKKEFTTPYVVVGKNGAGDWVDAVGTNSRVHRPYQGVFVKNEEYVKEGRSDVYDYYFCDRLNFCVRLVTPDGLVRTFAGHSPSTDGNIWGTEDGDLRNAARFRDVSGLAYDEATETFYVLDDTNRRIRYIGKEQETSIQIPDADEVENPIPEK